MTFTIFDRRRAHLQKSKKKNNELIKTRDLGPSHLNHAHYSLKVLPKAISISSSSFMNK